MAKIYTDTNALRYFGAAFADSCLAAELRDHMLLAPLSVMELLSQLGTEGAQGAFEAIQALPRVHDPAACGMLPWSDDLFRIAIFRLPPTEDVITPALNNAIVRVLNTATHQALREDGEEIRRLLNSGKDKAAKQFSDVLNGWRSEGPLSENEHQAIFARSIARRAGVDESTVDVKAVISLLNALYVFEGTRMQVGADHPDYNVDKHSNDVYDAELLIYLADPMLHLLTCDTGFRRVEESSQYQRVHIVDPSVLRNTGRAEQLIRAIVSGTIS